MTEAETAITMASLNPTKGTENINDNATITNATVEDLKILAEVLAAALTNVRSWT